MGDQIFDDCMGTFSEEEAKKLGLPENLDYLLGTMLEKLSSIKSDEFSKDLFESDKIRVVLLGGYARNAILDVYGDKSRMPKQRFTKDIDFYSPDAGLLATALDIPIVPGQGTTGPLTPLTQMEIFNSLSGMDRYPILEDMFVEGITGAKPEQTFKVYKANDCAEILIPTPECYIVNKLFAKTNEPERTKDLDDVNVVFHGLRNRPEIIKKIESTVDYFGLTELYKQAISQTRLD